MRRATIAGLLAGATLAAIVLVAVPAPGQQAPAPRVPCILVPPPSIPRLQLIAPPEMTKVTDGEGVDHEVTFGAVDTDSLKQVIAKQAALVVWSRYVWEKCGLGGGK